jgi:hypothetical protein
VHQVCGALVHPAVPAAQELARLPRDELGQAGAGRPVGGAAQELGVARAEKHGNTQKPIQDGETLTTTAGGKK